MCMNSLAAEPTKKGSNAKSQGRRDFYFLFFSLATLSLCALALSFIRSPAAEAAMKKPPELKVAAQILKLVC